MKKLFKIKSKKTKSQIHDVQKSPYLIYSGEKIKYALKIDSLIKKQEHLEITGWEVVSLGSSMMIGRNINSNLYSNYIERQDVISALKDKLVNGTIIRGFSVSIPIDELHDNIINITWAPTENTEGYNFSVKANEKKEVVKSMVDYEQNSIYKKLTKATLIDSDPLYAAAHIDHSGVISGRCGLIAGWIVAKPGWDIVISNEQHYALSVSNSLQYQREDIVKIFRSKFGQNTANAGFVMNWDSPLNSGESLKVFALNEDENTKFEILSFVPENVPSDPEGYARWAFNVPTPSEKFKERLDNWEGELINKLISERNKHFISRAETPEILSLGDKAEDSEVSLIIPLYNRWDFVEHQLSAFSHDNFISKNSEIIYVIDDPKLVTPIFNEVENLFNLYQVPFKVVWGHRNRGFSGANNLGVSVATGKKVLCLNSDAFPIKAGWLNKLCEILDSNPEYGMVGPRLLNPEGGMQHAGMEFFYSNSWKVWLNKHPMAGLDPKLDVKDKEIVEKPAITGACVLMKRDFYNKIGGFDEGYLIGDFEDSDLCLKVMSSGKKIGYTPKIELVHLERQSFSSLGDTSFRTLVVRFNAWRHTTRWDNEINEVMKKFSV